MPAYIIIEIKINNPQEYEGYKKLTPASLALYDGKFIVRGGKTKTLEGEWNPERIVILEFPTTEKAEHWWNSEEYAPAKRIRHQSATSKMILIEGFQQ